MPKRPKKPNDESHESTLGPLAKALIDVDGDNPTEEEPEGPGNGGDSEPTPEGESEKSEGPPEGETPWKASPVSVYPSSVSARGGRPSRGA
jgi:hypothetical protein